MTLRSVKWNIWRVICNVDELAYEDVLLKNDNTDFEISFDEWSILNYWKNSVTTLK